MADLQTVIMNNDAVDDEVQECLPVGERGILQPLLDPPTERRQVRHDRTSLGSLFA